MDQLKFTWWLMRLDFDQWLEKRVIQIAWALPRRLAYWAAIRVMAHATTGKYGTSVPDQTSIMDALKRWDDA